MGENLDTSIVGKSPKKPYQSSVVTDTHHHDLQTLISQQKPYWQKHKLLSLLITKRDTKTIK